MSDRPFPNVVVRKNVRNQSSRNGATPALIVVHDTEGGNVPQSSRDLEGLAGWFDNPTAQASSHVATDQDGNSARFVKDENKAWSQMYFNSVGLSIEQIGFATDDWASPAKLPQLRETARWVAYWSRHYGIPIRKATVTRDGRVTRSGVIQHRALGHLGGDHHDVDVAYPGGRVLSLARQYAKAQERA
jgi:hypothetical protein